MFAIECKKSHIVYNFSCLDVCLTVDLCVKSITSSLASTLWNCWMSTLRTWRKQWELVREEAQCRQFCHLWTKKRCEVTLISKSCLRVNSESLIVVEFKKEISRPWNTLKLSCLSFWIFFAVIHHDFIVKHSCTEAKKITILHVDTVVLFGTFV